MADEERPEEVQRWTAKRRAALIISLLKGETTAVEAARRHGLKVAEVEGWRDRFLLGAENALRSPERRRSVARGRDQSAQAQGGRADHGPGHSARGRKAPYDAGDVRRVMATWPGVSMRRVCRVKIVKNNGGNPNDPAQVIPVATVQNVLLTVKELKTYFGLNNSQVKGGVYDLGTQLVSLVT